MGNDVSSSKDYQIGQPFISNADSPVKVTIAPATNPADGKKYTVFQYPKEHGKTDEAVEKHIEVIRTTRHPYILKYCTCFDERSEAILVTEHVVPLDVAVEKQEKDEVFAGINNILEAVLFLHERSFICHNAISVSSVFVTDDGTWKLGAFENSTKVLRLSKQSYDNDVNGFAEFTLSVLEYLKDDAPDTTTFMNRLEEEFINEKKEVLGSLRLLLDDQFFKFTLLDVLNDLQNLTLMASSQKKQFFRMLADKILSLSAPIISRRIIPKLFSHFIITDPAAEESFLQHLFASGNDYCKRNDIKPLIDMEYFKKSSLLLILSLFDSRDTTIRLIIMKYLALYVDCIELDVLRNHVLPELLVGLKDTNDEIVTTTFHALGLLISLLGSAGVVGGDRTTYFFDRKPDFTRSPKQDGKAINSAHNVAEVLQKPTTSPRGTDPDTVALEKKRRRSEREQQREEQRKRRDQRRLERENTKTKILLSQKSDEAPQIDEAEVCDNTSEPDWEGFEAFSNDESELKDEKLLSSFTPEHEDEWGWNDTKGTDATAPLEISSNVQDISVVTPPHAGKIKSDKSIQKAKLKGMSLLNTKKIRTESNMENMKKTNTTSEIEKKDLGGEFHIKIDAQKFMSKEPDYFADMIPSINKDSMNRAVVGDADTKQISSKFSALDLISQEPSGWDDDDVWDNNE